MSEPLITLSDAVLSEESRRFTAPARFRLEPGEHIAILGPNGSGKTTLAETLMGRRALRSGSLKYGFPQGQIRYIAFQETYNRAEDGAYYYQQRFNSCDSESAPQVGELLAGIEADPQRREELYTLLDIRPMLDKRVIMLSSGELRKFQIVRMLLGPARVLVIDNPFIGLDKAARKLLHTLLEQLTGMSELQLIIIVSAAEDIPAFFTHVYELSQREVGPKQAVGTWSQDPQLSTAISPVLPARRSAPFSCNEVVCLSRVTIRYGERVILKELDWRIGNGEKWALSGPNGSGKSTLLSLISADNPQAYSQDIVLFGRRRGTGESIWDIKRRIGYVSSEMHRSFLRDIPAANMVASGFFDSVGLYHTPSPEQIEVARQWMAAFGIDSLADRSFVRLSSGEQRLVLLARAFVKDPDLLILDEPLNGLDPARKEQVKSIVEAFCARPGKSLIYVSHYDADLPRCITGQLALPSLSGAEGD